MRVVARTLANEAGLNPLRAAAHAAGMRAPDVSMDEADCIAESKEQQETEEQVAAQTLAGPEGPIIDKESRNDVVSDQDEVDDLLSSLGF